MRFLEQIQYRLRGFLYDQERSKYSKKSSYSDKVGRDKYLKNERDEEKPLNKFMSSLDEMDSYLEEKVEEWNLKIKR